MAYPNRPLASGMDLAKAEVPTADEFLLEAELAKRWRRSPRTLQRWRRAGSGLAFVQIGGRVLYPLADVLAHEAALRSDRGAGA